MDGFQKYSEFLSHKPNPIAEKYLVSGAQTRATIKGNQGGGCLKIGSKIQMLSGLIKNIEDVESGDKVLSIYDDFKIYPSVVKHKIDSGTKHLQTIRTSSGRAITATACHPFLTMNGWMPVVSLDIGSYIAVPRYLMVGPKTPVYEPPPEWVPKILGYLIGDGCTVYGAGFSNRDEAIINDIVSVLPDGVSINKVSDFSVSRTNYKITGNGRKGANPVINLLRETGIFGKNSYGKFVPDIIYEADDRTVSLFLSRLFSCDGWIDQKGVGYASVSSDLIYGVQSLLLRLGIPSRVRAKKSKNWGTNSIRTEERTDYQLVIRRLADVTLFSERVGIFSKQAKLDKYIEEHKDCVSKENIDVIPLDISYLLASMPKIEAHNNIQGTNWRYENNDLYKVYREARGKSITRRKAAIFGSIFNDNNLSKLSESDIIWDKIVSIDGVGEHQCYDLEIDGSPNFIANNIFAHNTVTTAYDATMRLLGIHPVKKRNVLNKPIRFVSKVKPGSDDDEENQQYVEFKRMYPREFIKKDVTARSSIMTVRNPFGGRDYKVEFMSSSQELDAFMSVQRSALYQDEEIEKVKWDESQIRLLKEGGDSTITLTPVRGMDWTFDSIWKRAKKIYRSKIIHEKFGFPEVEETGSTTDIEAFCWATDDNPVMTKEAMDRIFEGIDDDDDLAMRRYGVFRQVSGRIYKSFDEKIHKIPAAEAFEASLFRTYWNYRIIDYHQQKPWYVSYVAISPRNEWYVWNELVAKHEHRHTLDIRDEIKTNSLMDEDEEFNRATLIDPLAKVKQTNTGFSVFDDLAMGEYGLRRLTPADTKNTQGRMNVKMRLKNSLVCGVPGNNINKFGEPDQRYGIYMPTIWFMDNCTGHIDHFKSWRYVDWKQEHVKATRTVKRESEKYSDFCRNIEFLGALSPVWYNKVEDHWESSKLFQGNRHAA